MTCPIRKIGLNIHILSLFGLAAIGALVNTSVHAAGIAQFMEKKTLPEATIAVIDPETGASSSAGDALGVRLDVGDIILFKFAFTPAPDNAYHGIQSYLTEYIPSNTRVVGVRIMDANGQTVTPRYPGMSEYGCDAGENCGNFTNLPCTVGSSGCNSEGLISLQRGSIAQVHGDTGIFYAESTETRLTRYPNDQFIKLTNGTLMIPNEPVNIVPLKSLLEVGGPEVPIYAHNAWDWTQVQAYGTDFAISGNDGKGPTPFQYGSPVAGPQTYYQYEATEVGGNIHFDNVVGPWNRIRYPGSKIGYGPADSTGDDPATGQPYARMITNPVGDAVGWDITPANPVDAKALRWALGEIRVGVPQFVEVALEVMALPLDPNFGDGAGNHVNCGEVVSSHLASRRAGPVSNGTENPWSTYLGSPSCTYLRLLHDITGSTDLTILSEVGFSLRSRNLSINDETGVIIENRWDGTELDYLTTDAGPQPDGGEAGQFACGDDSSKTCLRWTIGTLAPSDEVNIDTTYWAKSTPGTGVVTVRYYSDQLPAPGYYETRDVYIEQPVAIPEVKMQPVLDPTVTPAYANGIYTLTGGLQNVGTTAGGFLEVNPRLPDGWSLVGNQISIGGVAVSCNVAAPNSPARPQCYYTQMFPAGSASVLTLSVNVPGDAISGLYNFDLQVWFDSVETYFDHLATIPVGLPRTEKPVVNCPITSTASSIAGTSVDGADITLYFNLIERGFTNEAPSGDGGTWEVNDYDYFVPTAAPFGNIYGGLEVSATAQVPGRLPSELSDRCMVTPQSSSFFTVGGSTSGLLGSGLVLQNNGDDDLPIVANGSFTFATPVANGSIYSVTVASQPTSPNQICSVSNGSGSLSGSDVTDVVVTCVTKPDEMFVDGFEDAL